QNRAGHSPVPEFAAQQAAVTVGKRDVQDHELVKALQAFFETLAVATGLNRFIIAFGRELLGERGAQHLIIVNEEDAFDVWHWKDSRCAGARVVMRQTLSRFPLPVYVAQAE